MVDDICFLGEGGEIIDWLVIAWLSRKGFARSVKLPTKPNYNNHEHDCLNMPARGWFTQHIAQNPEVWTLKKFQDNSLIHSQFHSINRQWLWNCNRQNCSNDWPFIGTNNWKGSEDFEAKGQLQQMGMEDVSTSHGLTIGHSHDMFKVRLHFFSYLHHSISALCKCSLGYTHFWSWSKY